MVSAINTALSGLEAAGQRLESSARNIAKSGQEAGAEATAERVDQVSLSTGGVQAHQHNTQEPIDLAHEIIEQKLASYDFKANLKTIKMADDMQKALLDIKS